MSRKIGILIFLIIGFLLLGFVREAFFLNLNAQINSIGNPASNFQIANWLNFLSPYSTGTLIKIKWVATLLFSFLFLLLTLVFVQIGFQQKENKNLTIIIFIGVLVLSGLSILIGWMIPGFSSGTYYFSRWLMGSAQSPLLPAMICLFIFYSNRMKKGIN